VVLHPGPDELDVVAAEDESGRVASVGWSWYKPGSPFVTLWGGTTAPKAQRRGRLYTAVDAGRPA